MGVPAKKPNLAQYSRSAGAPMSERMEGGIEWFAVQHPDGEPDEDCQCARCGSTALFADCTNCGGDGEVIDDRDWNLGGLLEEYRRCPDCRGDGGGWYCCSDREWCNANPMAGREQVVSTAAPREEADV